MEWTTIMRQHSADGKIIRAKITPFSLFRFVMRDIMCKEEIRRVRMGPGEFVNVRNGKIVSFEIHSHNGVVKF